MSVRSALVILARCGEGSDVAMLRAMAWGTERDSWSLVFPEPCDKPRAG